MKRFFVLLWFIPFAVFAQQPEQVYGKNKVMQPNAYYLEQLKLWKAVTEKEPLNANAWYNYYRSSRNAYIKGEEDNSQQSKGTERFRRLSGIVTEMETHVPFSYEFYFVKWLNGNNDLRLFPFLKKAHALSPGSPEPMLAMAFCYELMGKPALRDRFLEMYFVTDDYSPGLLTYGSNLLAGLEANAILLTEGDKDTEAAMIMQHALGHRRDVLLLNVNLLLIERYRNRKLKSLGLKPLVYDPLENATNYEKFCRELVELLSANRQKRAVYTAVTVSKPYTGSIDGRLFLTGLAYRYNAQPMDAIPQLKNNIEHVYSLDYIRMEFPNDISRGNVASMNGNYLYPFCALSKYYASTGDLQKAKLYKSYAWEVAEKGALVPEYEWCFGEVGEK